MFPLWKVWNRFGPFVNLFLKNVPQMTPLSCFCWKKYCFELVTNYLCWLLNRVKKTSLTLCCLSSVWMRWWQSADAFVWSPTESSVVFLVAMTPQERSRYRRAARVHLLRSEVKQMLVLKSISCDKQIWWKQEKGHICDQLDASFQMKLKWWNSYWDVQMK